MKITSITVGFGCRIFGLGDDNKVYEWELRKENWSLYTGW